MKNISIIISFFLLTIGSAIAQKKPLTDSSYKDWTVAQGGRISNDGRYLTYVVQNKPFNATSAVITSSSGKWRKSIINARQVQFSDNSKYAFYQVHDTVFQLLLGTNVSLKSLRCSEYGLIKYRGDEWYYLKQEIDVSNQLIVKRLNSNNSDIYKDIHAVHANEASGSLILESKVNGICELRWLNLATGKVKLIYSGQPVMDLIFDKTGQKSAFRTINNGQNALWYYHSSQISCSMILTDKTPGILANHTIGTNSTWKFGGKGNSLYFTQDTVLTTTSSISTQPLISNYRDSYPAQFFRSIQTDLNKGKNLTCLNLISKTFRQLLFGIEKPELRSKFINDIFVFSKQVSGDDKKRLQPGYLKNYYVYSLKHQKVYILQTNAKNIFTFSISPDGRYVMFRSEPNTPIKCFNLRTKKVIEISGRNYFGKITFTKPGKVGQVEFLGWEKSGKVLIQDQFDVWLVDAENRDQPRDLTNGQGQRTKTCYYPIIDDPYQTFITDDLPIYVAGYNIRDKKSTISKMQIRDRTFKELIQIDSKLLEIPSFIINAGRFCKARDTNVFLLQLECAETVPNYFVTGDFQQLVKVSDEHPEKIYKWLKAELISYNDKFGQNYQAVLYKPEDFDSTKKYPVIFRYYRHVSNNYHKHITPEPVSSSINIPLMVNAGFLVVCPDIIDGPGMSAGESALTSINAVSDYMNGKQYVDSTRLGLCGHSFGGYETNYIITHSNRFAAALSAAGMSNIVQYVYDSNNDVGQSNESFAKNALSIPLTLDSNAVPYIKESALLFAKNVQTPLLLVHNDRDLTVDVSQTAQFYYQLRALRKRVWWLNYSGEAHTIERLENQVDYQQKTLGFFNHYLRDMPIASWMNKPNAF